MRKPSKEEGYFSWMVGDFDGMNKLEDILDDIAHSVNPVSVLIR